MGIGPSTKETSLHHFRDPLLEVVSEDTDLGPSWTYYSRDSGLIIKIRCWLEPERQQWLSVCVQMV